MGLGKKTVEELAVKGKRVLVRCDFNVPMKEGVITNDNRIVAALPTIQKLIDNGAKVILCSHLGKPKNGPEEKFSLAPVAVRLSELLGKNVVFANDDTVVGENAKAAVAAMNDGDVVLLQNTRFRKEETKNLPEFSQDLASIADCYVNDAFGSAHRAHCSTAGVTDYVKDTAAGFMALGDCEAAIGQEVNIATGEEHSIGDLAAELIRQINPEAKIVCDEQRLRPENSEVNRLLGDASKMRALTGWKPAYTFEQGLAATIEFLRGNMERYKPDVYNL